MSWRIIDITQDGQYLHIDRENLVVAQKKMTIATIPLSDIQSVIVHSSYATYSHELLLKLSKYDIPLVLCDYRHEPISFLVSVTSHHTQANRVRMQSESSMPLRKRIWRDLIKSKITEQARTLGVFDEIGCRNLKKMATKVKSGDPENIEAQAARYYWQRLFGKGFHRDRSAHGLNAHLNYGYTILRSALARAVIASGLMPSFGVGHCNMRNNFALVDDLIEPFRPLVDRIVWENRKIWNDDVSIEAKSSLAGMMERTILNKSGETDLFRTMTLLVNSLVAIFEKREQKLEMPDKIEFNNSASLFSQEC